MNKIYFSPSQSRAWALDHPIGDPFGGAAYGEKNGPAVAVIASVAAAVATDGASLAMEGAFGAMTLTQGLAVAGAALTTVGAVTKDQTLMQFGQVATLGSGISALMTDPAISVTTDAAGNTTNAYSGVNNGGTAINPSGDTSNFDTGSSPMGNQSTLPTADAATAGSIQAANTAGTPPAQGLDKFGNIANPSDPGYSQATPPGGIVTAGASTNPLGNIGNDITGAFKKFTDLPAETQNIIAKGLAGAFPTPLEQAQAQKAAADAGFSQAQSQALQQQIKNQAAGAYNPSVSAAPKTANPAATTPGIINAKQTV